MLLIRCVTLAAACLLLIACNRPEAVESGDSLRIVTLAPHLTELVFAAGAGDALVGVSAWSDYPPAALDIPVVSDAFTVDQEQLALLTPTLILAWDGGNPVPLIEELRASGYRVEAVRTHGLDDIPTAIERIGELAESPVEANRVAEQLRQGISDLRTRYSRTNNVSVFYQISSQPLYTVGGSHYISDIIALCGGRNVFAELHELAPAVTAEAVIDRNPEAMLAAESDSDVFGLWDRWPVLHANQLNNRFTVSADEIGRPSTRLVSAARAVCEHLDTARSRLAGGPR